MVVSKQSTDAAAEGASYLGRNRRKDYPRIEVKTAAEVMLGNGEHVRLPVYDISSQGVQLRCDGTTAQKIQAADKGREGDEREQLKVSCSLPLKNGKTDIVAESRVVWVREMKQDQFAIGFRFKDLPKDSVERLKRFIAESMEPAF